jgi:hypothetical protein
MNYNICITWWSVIASSCYKSLVFERMKLLCLRDYLFLAQNLSEYSVHKFTFGRYRICEASLVCETPGLCFLWPKSLGLHKFETYEFERFRKSIGSC